MFWGDVSPQRRYAWNASDGSHARLWRSRHTQAPPSAGARPRNAPAWISMTRVFAFESMTRVFAFETKLISI